MLPRCSLEPHGTMFRRPSDLAHLWVEEANRAELGKSPGSAVGTPGSFLKSRLYRTMPFAETAFPSLTLRLFLITALSNNSQATQFTISSAQFSGFSVFAELCNQHHR